MAQDAHSKHPALVPGTPKRIHMIWTTRQEMGLVEQDDQGGRMITKDCTVMMAHAGTWSWAPLQIWGLQGLYGDSGESARKARGK